MAEWRAELESEATRGDTPMKPQLVLGEVDRRSRPMPSSWSIGTCTTWAARYLRMPARAVPHLRQPGDIRCALLRDRRPHRWPGLRRWRWWATGMS